MLKPAKLAPRVRIAFQPPSGGCVLKLEVFSTIIRLPLQPPSGGCVLKPFIPHKSSLKSCPAAFGRLRVETFLKLVQLPEPYQPPSGGCVLKHHALRAFQALHLQPPSGGCVLKPHEKQQELESSHPAAFGRLRVETAFWVSLVFPKRSSRLRAAAC